VVSGWRTRWAAGAWAVFTLVAGVIFHNNCSDQMQMIMFLKNLAISGGLLLLVVHGAGSLSLDQRFMGKRGSQAMGRMRG